MLIKNFFTKIQIEKNQTPAQISCLRVHMCERRRLRALCGKRTVKENINRMLVHRPGSVFGRKEEKGAGRETNRNQKSPVCGDFGICPIPFDKCASIPRMGDDNLPDCSFCPGYFVLYAEESLGQD